MYNPPGDKMRMQASAPGAGVLRCSSLSRWAWTSRPPFPSVDVELPQKVMLYDHVTGSCRMLGAKLPRNRRTLPCDIYVACDSGDSYRWYHGMQDGAVQSELIAVDQLPNFPLEAYMVLPRTASRKLRYSIRVLGLGGFRVQGVEGLEGLGFTSEGFG